MAHRGATAGQLTLDFVPVAPAAGLPNIAPMSPVMGSSPFDDEDWFFEPWWPGAQVIAYVERGGVRLQTEHLADADAAFPELAGIGRQFAIDRAIVHGTLLVLDDDGLPDAELLRRRLTGEAGAARFGFGAFVASDLLYVRGQSLVAWPFSDRRSQLTRVLSDGDACVVGRGLRGDGTTLADAAAAMGMSEISARRLSARYQPGIADEGWRRLPITAQAVQPVKPFLVLLQKLPL